MPLRRVYWPRSPPRCGRFTRWEHIIRSSSSRRSTVASHPTSTPNSGRTTIPAFSIVIEGAVATGFYAAIMTVKTRPPRPPAAPTALRDDPPLSA